MSNCLKQRLVWCQYSKERPPTAEQYTELPRALANADEIPHKGKKSGTTLHLKIGTKGKLPPIPSLPDGFLTKSFLRACSSLTQHLCRHTPTFLLKHFLSQYSQLGVPEICMDFDDPGRLKNHPKQLSEPIKIQNPYHSMSTTTLLMIHRYPGNGMRLYWLAALANAV